MVATSNYGNSALTTWAYGSMSINLVFSRMFQSFGALPENLKSPNWSFSLLHAIQHPIETLALFKTAPGTVCNSIGGGLAAAFTLQSIVATLAVSTGIHFAFKYGTRFLINKSISKQLDKEVDEVIKKFKSEKEQIEGHICEYTISKKTLVLRSEIAFISDDQANEFYEFFKKNSTRLRVTGYDKKTTICVSFVSSVQSALEEIHPMKKYRMLGETASIVASTFGAGLLLGPQPKEPYSNWFEALTTVPRNITNVGLCSATALLTVPFVCKQVSALKGLWSQNVVYPYYAIKDKCEMVKDVAILLDNANKLRDLINEYPVLRVELHQVVEALDISQILEKQLLSAKNLLAQVGQEQDKEGVRKEIKRLEGMQVDLIVVLDLIKDLSTSKESTDSFWEKLKVRFWSNDKCAAYKRIADIIPLLGGVLQGFALVDVPNAIAAAINHHQDTPNKLCLATFESGQHRSSFNEIWYPGLVNTNGIQTSSINFCKTDDGTESQMWIYSESESGKSSFMRALATSILFAQKLGIGFAQEINLSTLYDEVLLLLDVKGDPGKVVEDGTGISGYRAELEGIEQIFERATDHLSHGRRPFVICDEICKGVSEESGGFVASLIGTAFASLDLAGVFVTQKVLPVILPRLTNNRISNKQFGRTPDGKRSSYQLIDGSRFTDNGNCTFESIATQIEDLRSGENVSEWRNVEKALRIVPILETTYSVIASRQKNVLNSVAAVITEEYKLPVPFWLDMEAVSVQAT
jgi:hypothetical protein